MQMMVTNLIRNKVLKTVLGGVLPPRPCWFTPVSFSLLYWTDDSNRHLSAPVFHVFNTNEVMTMFMVTITWIDVTARLQIVGLSHTISLKCYIVGR